MNQLTLTDYKNLILQWSKDRNIIGGSTAEDQIDKLFEEVGELVTGMNKGNINLIKDSIGDCFVCLVNIAGITLEPKLRDELFETCSRGELDIPESKFKPMLALCIQDTYLTVELETAITRGIKQFFDLFNSITKHYNLTLLECVAIAWEEIKDRKSKMIDGKFVKEEDL